MDGLFRVSLNRNYRIHATEPLADSAHLRFLATVRGFASTVIPAVVGAINGIWFCRPAKGFVQNTHYNHKVPKVK